MLCKVMFFLEKILILFVLIYKHLISPFLYPSCRYDINCSTYMIVMLKKYGPIKGFILGLIRIMKCNPFF